MLDGISIWVSDQNFRSGVGRARVQYSQVLQNAVSVEDAGEYYASRAQAIGKVLAKRFGLA